ncbi:MAG: hypothetical protein QW331_00625 [Candidatus Woesearchaeota archaeon]
MAETKEGELSKEQIIERLAYGAEDLKGKEHFEELPGQFSPNVFDTGYPNPIKRYRLVWDNFSMSMEESYFWVLRNLKQSFGYSVEKTVDSFSMAEQSSFFGVAMQRLGIQQDKVAQYFATIGKMVKDLFAIVRELRIIDERRGYYEKSYSTDEKIRAHNEVILKGLWIDVVEGGAKNPASVFGMATQGPGFITLPDLFFRIHPRNHKEIPEMVDKQEFNDAVKIALKRKLGQFIEWKDSTYKELLVRRTFQIKYLRQHYEVIQMYINWIKPYLKFIKRMHTDLSKLDQPEIIAAFETSMIEIELLATKKVDAAYSVIIAHFLFEVKPMLNFQAEGYQRGPLHVGKMTLNLRGYAWTKEEIALYKKLKKYEDLDLLRTISSSVEAAVDALGDDLKKYIVEAEGTLYTEKKEEKKEEKKTFKEALFGDFISKAPKEKKVSKKKIREEEQKIRESKEKIVKSIKPELHNLFKFYKKAHAMIMW